MDEGKVSRRTALRRSLTVLAALPVASLIGCGGAPAAVTCGGATPEQQTMRTALQYTENGPDAARHCINCQLFTGNATSCGSCQVLQGEISPQASCTSFVQRA